MGTQDYKNHFNERVCLWVLVNELEREKEKETKKEKA